MGPFRQQLIRLVSCLVAIDLAIGVVALFARNDGASTVRLAAQSSNTAPPSAGSPGNGTITQSGGILTGGTFSRRRGSKGQSANPAATGTTATAPPSTAAAPSTRPPALSTRGSSPSKMRPAAPAAGQGRATITSPSGPASASMPPPAASDQPATPGEPAAEADHTAPTGAAPGDASTTPTSTPKKTQAPSTTSGVWTVTDDATGDTVVDGSGAPQANARADIVQSRVANTTKAIGLAVKVADPVDPTRDPNWASPATFVDWEVDTTGDGKPDFEIQYFVDGGKLIAAVYKAGNTAGQPTCEGEAGYTSDSYLAGVDPACIGSPTSLSYRASIYYGTDPKNPDADGITDVSPDGGMSGQVPRTAA